MGAEIGAFEETACERVRGIGDDDRVWLGNRLQACGQIRSLAGNRSLLRRAFADDVAHDHPASSDADAHRKRPVLGRRQRLHGIEYAQPRIDGALGVVLVRLWPTEVDQQPVAHELREEPVEARHDAGTGVLIGADQIAVVLGVELRRQSRRGNEIAEHDAHLAPLGVGRAALFYARRWRTRLPR